MKIEDDTFWASLSQRFLKIHQGSLCGDFHAEGDAIEVCVGLDCKLYQWHLTSMTIECIEYPNTCSELSPDLLGHAVIFSVHKLLVQVLHYEPSYVELGSSAN